MWKIILALIFVFPVQSAFAQPSAAHIPARCPFVGDVPETPRTITVRVLGASAHPDVDTDTIFGDDRADIAGSIVVNGATVPLREITGSDRPEWPEGQGSFTFDLPPDLVQVPIKIDLYDVDGGLSGESDNLDISPNPSRKHLELVFNRCSLRVSGDVEGVASSVLSSSGNSESGELTASVRFRISADEGIITSPDDLVLLDFDMIQVIPEVPTLISGKGTVLYVRVANTSPNPVTVPVDVSLSGPGGFSFVERTNLPEIIPPRTIKDYYLYRDRPIIIPDPTDTERSLSVRVQIDPEGIVQKLTNNPNDLCRRQNDGISIDDNRPPRWKIVKTRIPQVNFAAVDGLIHSRFANIQTVRRMASIGSSYMKAIYPVSDVRVTIDPGTNQFIASSISEFFLRFFNIIGIPADSLIPFITLIEMNAAYSIAGADKVVGVVRPHWFEQFIYGLWDETTGVSLGPAGSYAVLAEAGRQRLPLVGIPIDPPAGSNIYRDNPLGAPISMTLPVHEISHTFGLSSDPDLKDSVFCGIDEDLAQIACGIGGGFDEYKHQHSSRRRGNATRGFWVRRGDEPAEVAPLTNRAYCDSRCVMGSTPNGDYLAWDSNHKLIDRADYLALIDKLAITPDPAVLVVNGIIGGDGTTFMMPFFRTEGIPSLNKSSNGLYQWRFLDRSGNILQIINMPIQWTLSEMPSRPPAMPFSHVLPWEPGTARIELHDRSKKQPLFSREVSQNAPKVRISRLSPRRGVVREGEGVRLTFSPSDEDGDRNFWFLPLISRDGKSWSPMGAVTNKRSFRYRASQLEKGRYFVKVMVSDGVNASSSPVRSILVRSRAG